MADRIINLTNEPAPADTVSLIIDDPSYSEAKSTTKAQFFAAEVLARGSADTAIKTGAGLETDGSMAPMPGSTFLKDTDYAAAGYAKNLKNGLLLLDAAINTLANTNELDLQFTITNAEMLDLFTTSVVKLAAPGAGTFYHMTEVIAKLNYVAPAFVTNAAGVQIRFVGASDYIATLSQAFLQSAATTRKKFLVAEHTIPVNTAIEVFAPVANPTNGGGSVDVIVRYQILNDFTGAVVSPSCCVSPLAGTFVNADLTAAGNLVITHNLGTTNVFVVILDNINTSIAANYSLGDEAGADTSNKVTVPIGLGIAGTWKYMIFGI